VLLTSVPIVQLRGKVVKIPIEIIIRRIASLVDTCELSANILRALLEGRRRVIVVV
jgi:hypothetical protein